MSDQLTKADVIHVKALAGDFEGLHERDWGGICIMLSRGLKIGMFLLIRALEDTAK